MPFSRVPLEELIAARVQWGKYIAYRSRYMDREKELMDAAHACGRIQEYEFRVPRYEGECGLVNDAKRWVEILGKEIEARGRVECKPSKAKGDTNEAQ